MSSRVKCTCGWSWNKSDSSVKDMYICHECGRDNSNNMKNGGWLDNYGEEENANDSQVSFPEGFVGEGTFNGPKFDNPAVKGQFAMGGTMPGAVGFSYARTQGIPSEGKYAKKTLPSAQDGNKLNPLSYPQPDHYSNINPFFVRDPEHGIFVGGVNPTYSTKDFSIGASAVGVGNKDFIKPIVDYGIRGSYNPTDSLSINANISKGNVGAGLRYRFENGGDIAQNGQEMEYYREGLDWKPKSISESGAWLDDYDVAQNGKKKVKLKDERLQAIKLSESTNVKKKNFDLEQTRETKTYLNQLAAQQKEDKRRKALTKDQREREDYNARNEERGSIQATVPESKWERTKAIVSNPMTAIGYAARNESLPARFQLGPRNEYDYATDWINPLQGIAAATEIPGELSRGEYLNAGLSLLDAADLGVYAKGAMKASKPLLQKAGKALGTEEGLLSNAWKLNPNAEKLNNANSSYRVAGLDAFEDFKNTGVVRSGDGSLHTFKFADSKGNFHQIKRPTGFPSFQKGYADMRYAPEEGAVVFETGLPTFKRGEINPVTGNRIRGRHYAHRVIDPETGLIMTEIPAADVRLFGDKPHWWKGYKEVPKQEDGGIIKNDVAQTGKTVEYGTPEYEEAYNRGEVVTDEGEYSPILLDEVVIKRPSTEFGKVRKELSKYNSWEKYAQKFLGEFEKNMGQTLENLPEYRKQEYEDYINKLAFNEYIKTHPQAKGEKRGAYIDRIQAENANSSNFKRAYEANADYNDATDVNKWRKSLIGLGSIVLPKLAMDRMKQSSDYFSKEEKEDMIDNPISTQFGDVLGTLEPLTIPVESLYGNKSFGDIASGQSADIPMSERILGDPLMLGFEAAPLLMEGVKGLRGASTVTKALSEESALSKLNMVDEAVASKPWSMQELPGLHLQSTMDNGAISKIVEPKSGLINTEQALAIIGKESGGSDKVALIKQG